MNFINPEGLDILNMVYKTVLIMFDLRQGSKM